MLLAQGHPFHTQAFLSLFKNNCQDKAEGGLEHWWADSGAHTLTYRKDVSLNQLI